MAGDDNSAQRMVGVNDYHRVLSESEIAADAHRASVGRLWEEVGELQFQFMIAQGLRPDHRLADIGCGALRGGLHFVRYLDRGHYHGLDLNASLIAAGRLELERAGLTGRDANLLVDDQFNLSRFGCTFDYAISVSLMTHLFSNHIARCFWEMRKVMHEESRFFVTFFEAPSPVHLEPIRHSPGEALTYFDADPFHYSFPELAHLARQGGLRAQLVGAWGHPRDQRMVCLTPILL